MVDGLPRQTPPGEGVVVPEAAIAAARWFDERYRVLLQHRAGTIRCAAIEMAARGGRTIVETGCTRRPNNWGGDGQSTVVLGDLARQLGGRLHACDVSAEAVAVARGLTRPIAAWVDVVESDSVAFLSGFGQKIDLLYLDSLDVEGDGSAAAEHAMRELVAALPWLHADSLVLIDDCGIAGGGKGARAVPYLVESGYWFELAKGYQSLLSTTAVEVRAMSLLESGVS